MKKKRYVSPAVKVQAIMTEDFIAATRGETQKPGGGSASDGPQVNPDEGSGEDYGAKENFDFSWDEF